MKTEISKIYEKYKNKEYAIVPPYEYKALYKKEHIFDSTKSVDWNNQQVTIENEKIHNYRKEYQIESAKKASQMYEEILLAISNDYNISKEKAKIVYDYVYNEYHAFMSDVFNYINDVMELINNYNKAE